MLSKECYDNTEKDFFCAMLSLEPLDNIAQGFYLYIVGPCLTDNFYEENNISNAVCTMPGQYMA